MRHDKERSRTQRQAGWDPLIQMQAGMTKTAERIEERRAAFFANPTDKETIHRFRTFTRTLRSLVAFIKPWQKSKQNAETQALLKEIVGYTSLLRELDVLEKQAGAKSKGSPELLAFCEEQAAVERAQVLATLRSKRVDRLFERAMFLAKSVTWKTRYAQDGLSASEVRARFDALVKSVGDDLEGLKLTDAERTHDVRKRAKRARYVAECYGHILGEDAVGIAKGMTAHQDILGGICDARANIRLIDSFLQRNPPKSVAKELKQMRAQNEAFLRKALRAGAAERG